MFDTMLPQTWMLPPKTPTLEEQQMETPEFQDLTQTKESLADIEKTRPDEKAELKKVLSEKGKSARENALNAYLKWQGAQSNLRNYNVLQKANPEIESILEFEKKRNEAYKNYLSAQEEEARIRDVNARALDLRISRDGTPTKDYADFLAQSNVEFSQALQSKSPKENIKWLEQRKALGQTRKPTEVTDAQVQEEISKSLGQEFRDKQAEFEKRKAEAVKKQNTALSVFEEAKKRVKYRPPAGVPLDERGVPITA
jgi:hypothetical protein